MSETYETGLDRGPKGKVAVVTGAGRMRSIGRSIAVELARAGCDIVVTGTGRSPDRYPDDEKEAGWRDIASVGDEIRDLGCQALELVSDVTAPEAVAKLAEQTLAHFGRVDIVINNAGAPLGDDRKPVVDVPTDAWRKLIDVNLNGTFYMCQAFGQRLIEQGEGGSIVNISSIAGKMFPPNSAAYAASKAAIQALTASMAREVGSHGIRVNAICPGMIETYRMDNISGTDAWKAMVQQMVPLGRAGVGQDIANMAAFLCSERASWITGQSYNVDGGTVVQH